MTLDKLLKAKPWDGKELVWMIGRQWRTVQEYAQMLHARCPYIGYSTFPEAFCCTHSRDFPIRATQLRDKDPMVPRLVTTMSPYLLDECDLERDEVLIVLGPNDVRLLDRERLADMLGEFKLGEIWHNEGEEFLAGIRRDDA